MMEEDEKVDIQLICKPRDVWEQQRWDMISMELTVENLRARLEHLEYLEKIAETKV